MTRLFGTDGVRGVANIDLTPELAFKLGFAAAHVLTDRTEGRRPLLIIGEDTRVSCAMLSHSLMAGITSAGADVIHCGVVPTPAIAWLTTFYKADAGVVVSASHNSFEFNGIKLFAGDGYKLADATEDLIEADINNFSNLKEKRPSGEKVGRSISDHTAIEHYRKHLEEMAGLDLSAWRIGLDCANGASYKIAPQLFQELGAEIFTIGTEPSGYNINLDCGSLHLDKLAVLVKEKNLDIGFAFDGDADRVLAVDAEGEIADGDVIMAILALDLMKRGELKDNTLVATVMSNLGLELMANDNNMKLKRTQVGDRYVIECMREGHYVLGGEQSGHIILANHSTTGDGILSALHLLQALNNSGKSLSEAKKSITICPQVLKNAKVPEKAKKIILQHEKLTGKISEIEKKLAKSGRVLVRASGTEPLIRVMLEGQNIAEIDKYADEIVDSVNTLARDLAEE